MKLKIKLFLWQLWLTLVVWMTFFSAPAMGGKDFFLTITFGVIALLIVWFLLYNDFSPPSDYSDAYSGFFVHSPEIAAVIERLMGLSAFFGAVLAVLVSLVAYNIFGDEYVTRAAFKVFVLLFVCMMGGTSTLPGYGKAFADWRDYISKRYFYTYLVIGSLLIVAPMLWQLFTHQEQIKVALGF